MKSFLGYERADGSVGIRNYLAVIPSVACANGVVNQIVNEVEGAIPITHGYGCGAGPSDLVITSNTLSGIGKNPNVGAVLVIGLGCEVVNVDSLANLIVESGKSVEHLLIQEYGGSQKTMEKGIEIVRKMSGRLSNQARVEVPFDKLVIGLECGGSDAFSGVTANPCVGAVSDWLVERGCTVILSETTEMIGAEHVLERRAMNEEVRRRIAEIVSRMEQATRDVLGPLAGMVIAPGNIDGGISTITEKSLGCIRKGGTSPIVEVLEYAQAPTKKGLVIMDTPGYDVESISALSAGGAQLILFTTGRGTPAGSPISPTVKIASNSETYHKMKDDIDINAGTIIDGDKSIAEVRDEIVQFIEKVIEGKKPKAELNKQAVFGILKTATSF